MIPGPRRVRGPLVAILVLLHATRFVQSRGERVHFRIHTADLVNSQTHTRTVFLPPELFHAMQRGLVAPRQPISYMRQTVYIPRGTNPQLARGLPVPVPGQLHHGFRPVPAPGLGGAGSAALALRHVPVQRVPVHVTHHRAPPHHHISTTSVILSAPRGAKPQQPPQPQPHQPQPPQPLYLQPPQPNQPQSLYLQPPQPQPHQPQVLFPQPAEPQPALPLPVLIPMTVTAAVAGPKSAALKTPPSQDELKKSKGCRAFVKGRGEELADGDCFLEEYEKGYNEEQSKKTFFGDENSDVNTEKGGERQSRRYKNQHEYEHHPKLRHEWVEAPGGRHHLLRTHVGKSKLFPESMKMVTAAKPVVVPITSPPAKVALIRMLPGTAKVLLRPASDAGKEDAKKDGDDDGWDEDDEPRPRSRQRAPSPSVNSILDEEDPDINPVEQSDSAGLVEVFKHSARSVPVASGREVIRPIWMEAYRPLADDDFDVEESTSKPLSIAKVAALVTEARLVRPLTDDTENSWTLGINEDDFKKEPQTADKDEFHVDFDEEMKAIREDDEEEDDEEDRKQADSSKVRDSFAMVNGKGRAEKMLHRSKVGPLRDSPRLSAILATGGHVFLPPTPPAPHPAAFGVKDPDRLEAGRKAPIVVEFGHELSGFKVTREKEQKKWR